MKLKIRWVICLMLIAIEGSARVFGLTDFPTYIVAPDIGYMPKPNQAGAYLNRNDWVFNDRSMGTALAWSPGTRPNILLIGNSIVMGGDQYPQSQKLGPLIQEKIGPGYALWPIATGGWTNVNEIAYLDRNPDVARACTYVVWEYMAGGLSKLAPWPGEYVFPTTAPHVATWFVFRHFLLPRFFAPGKSGLPPRGPVDPNNLARFARSLSKLSCVTAHGAHGTLFLYPTLQQYLAARAGQEWLPERGAILHLASVNGLRVVDVAKFPEWNESLYREDRVHPTVQGNAVLGQILFSAISPDLRR